MLRERDVVGALFDGAKALDQSAIRAALDSAHAALGLERTIADVVMPFLRALGDGWSKGSLDVESEHAASDVVGAWLDVHRLQHPASHPDRILISCGPEDEHALGAGCFAALLAHRGWGPWLLAHPTSPGSLALAIETLRPSATIVVSHLPASRDAAVKSLRRVAGAAGRGLFYAGGAFDDPAARDGLPGTYLGTDLLDAAGIVERSLG